MENSSEEKHVRVQLVSEFQVSKSDKSKDDSSVHFKSIDVHPRQPWVLCRSQRTENTLEVWSYKDGTRVASWVIPDWDRGFSSDAKFIAQKGWIVANFRSKSCVYELQGSNLHCVQVLEHVSIVGMLFVHEIAIHPNAPYILVLFGTHIVLWDWSKDWEKITIEPCRNGPLSADVVMFNPTDLNTFTIAYRCGPIDIWDIGTRSCIRRLQTVLGVSGQALVGVDFCSRPEKSLMLSCHCPFQARENDTIVVWDYKKGVEVTKLRVGRDGLRTAFFHPHLPYILGASCDGHIRVWDESNYRLVASYRGMMQLELRGMTPCKDSNHVLLFDREGLFLVLNIAMSGVNNGGKVSEGGNKGGIETMQTTLVSAKRPRTPTPIADTDEPASVSNKRLVEMKDKADCDSPDWEKTTQKMVSDLELKWMKALNELREQHAQRVEKLEYDVRILNAEKRVQKLEDELRYLKAEKRVQKLEDEVRDLKAEKRVQELEDEVRTEMAAMAERNGESEGKIQEH
ncbi:hypothetical protein CBR_g8077 [Chara braunii]|uniref:Uncharacterized protein n=1 Tax=Chara braunii TaxID=69332 RepID=A0A388KL40_CHABU|nr:hypothetical protein CBR_g8077 [Chara braunii]|eukprot:GBG70779.1 hypothetical protein CBR_g8077 [Chara braunii]